MNAPERLISALAERYRIEGELGMGGMATVYLATDLRHDRKVAIKVLKPELAAIIGAQRFLTEIKTTARLQHPNILPLFDSGEADGFLFYVMPYIQGETIREKLDRETQFGIDDAVEIITAVADALDYAHRQGVIHRDIKPENILLHDGRPMVMDFGIALAVSAAAGGRMTETGLSLGTPHYMSPEQATADKTITARSDVYSMASVLYEMLAGDPPHTASSAQATILRIITEPVEPVTRHRKAVPEHVAAALSRALEKLPADRFESARDFADALGDSTFRLPGAVGAGEAAKDAGGWRARLALPLAALSVLLATALAFTASRPSPGGGLDRPTFASLDVSDLGVVSSGSNQFAVSPDGRSVAFATTGGLALRSLDSMGVARLQRTADAVLPFWSPDGRAIAFFARDSLRIVDIASGAVRALCPMPRVTAGGTWSPDGTILFASGDSLFTTDAGGGPCVGERGPAGETRDRALKPQFLSDGRHYVVSGDMQVWMGELGSDSLVLLQEVFRHRGIVAAPDYLLWKSNGRLVAQRIDIAERRLVGEPVAILPDVPNPGSHTAVSASQTGVLVAYVRDAADGERPGLLISPRRSGQFRSIPQPPFGWQGLRYSRDGSRIGAGGWQVGAVDVATGQTVRIGGSRDGPEAPAWDPLWTPGDTATLFVFGPAGDEGLYSASVSVGDNRRLAAWPPPPLADCCIGWLDDLTPDGRRVAFAFGASRFLLDEAWEYDLEAESARRLFDADGRIDHLRYAPSGDLIAYQVTAGTRTDVFVRPYPGPGTPIRVTNGGGQSPRWGADGSELFYLDEAGNIVSVAVRGGATPSLGEPQVELSADLLPDRYVARFDVSPDGQEIALRASTYVESFQLVFNWHGLLDAAGR